PAGVPRTRRRAAPALSILRGPTPLCHPPRSTDEGALVAGIHRCYRPPYAIRQTQFPPSSVTSIAPSAAVVTPTGRPHTVPAGVTKPVRKSWYSPVGTPRFNGTRITL